MLAVQEGRQPSIEKLIRLEGQELSNQDSTPLVGRIWLRWQTRQRNNSLYKAETRFVNAVCRLQCHVMYSSIIFVFVLVYLLVKSCLLITLIKCFKCFSILVHSDVLCRLKYLVVTARQTKGKVTYWAILDN